MDGIERRRLAQATRDREFDKIMRKMFEAIPQLPEPDQTAARMFIAGHSGKAVGRRLGVSPQKAYGLRKRAFNRMRDLADEALRREADTASET